ncbi:sensor histidine kinase [Microlunatus ginsengisoli]|uniref:histidine kinase n=1 Tax=Microlunatus ginsengisoli TaxID=363863 RepID=A0ABP7AMB4_9ACTN
MSGRSTSIAITAVGGVLLAVCLVLGGFARSAALPLSPYTITNLVIGVGYLVPAAVIAWHRPRNLLVLLLFVGGVGHLLAGIGVAGVAWGAAAGWSAWLIGICGLLLGIAWKFGMGPLFALLLLLFPDGRLPSRRWRWLVWASFGSLALALAGWFVAPDALIMNLVVQLGDLAVTTAAIVSLVMRYRRGDEMVRGQILWLVLAVMVMLVLNVERAITGRGPELLLLSFVCIPVAIAIAIVRYQLLDIRLVVSRTLLYGLLIGAVLLGYVGLVALATAVLPADLATWGPVTSAIVVALALNPVRLGLQRLITQAFYGRRDNPEALAAAVGDVEDLAEVLERARTALRLPGLAVRSTGGLTIAGETRSGTQETLPLTIRGEELGHLIVTLRTGESRLHRQDAAALGMLAGPLALLLREQALADALRTSRAQVVRARESERSLLHRDLHDGLGPTLTNAAFRADAAANQLTTDPEAAATLLAEARVGIREALADVRRVVYGLRPLALEELGLVGAIREQASKAGRLPVSVSATSLGPLPPAVELAAYRIATEAITNAQRHSTGSQVRVQLTSRGEQLELMVRDNGASRPATPGIGLRSITERADELSGRTEIVAGEDGWRVTVWIPCGSA